MNNNKATISKKFKNYKETSYFLKEPQFVVAADQVADLIVKDNLILFLPLSYHYGNPKYYLEQVDLINDAHRGNFYKFIIISMDIEDKYDYLMDIQLELVKKRFKVILVWDVEELEDHIKEICDIIDQNHH